MPVGGEIVVISESVDPNDVHISIQPDGHPAFAVKLFQVDPTDDIEANMTVAAGGSGSIS